MSVQVTYPICPLVLEPKNVIPLTWHPICHITYDRNVWVKLFQPVSESSFDEALLLCQESSDTWVTWVPDHGEIVLDRSNFYC